ncbi:MAG: type I glutamate--ammonia ligase, partial [Phycisphaerae bacterium]|nr:type I glutamate--ammonia ligase [Phycisphaerae bacterium]
SVEGEWRRGRDEPDNLGLQLKARAGHFPTPPADSMADLRGEMVVALQDAGLDIESHHHEVATGGQAEIDLRCGKLVEMADKVMILKHTLRNVAARHGKVVTFMPKPLLGDNGSGMHTHFSLWKDDQPLFFGDKYADLSETALWAIGGIVRHAASLMAFTNPTTNSYKRLVPGYEAPVNLVYSVRNRSAFIRIPVYQRNPCTKRIEVRAPDPSCNPYLAFSAILMAALDGIERRIDPGPAIDTSMDELTTKQRRRIKHTPATLHEALRALLRDHDYLLRGGVFTEDLIHYWIEYKMNEEVLSLARRPHPYEFCMYFGV